MDPYNTREPPPRYTRRPPSESDVQSEISVAPSQISVAPSQISVAPSQTANSPVSDEEIVRVVYADNTSFDVPAATLVDALPNTRHAVVGGELDLSPRPPQRPDRFFDGASAYIINHLARSRDIGIIFDDVRYQLLDLVGTENAAQAHEEAAYWSSRIEGFSVVLDPDTGLGSSDVLQCQLAKLVGTLIPFLQEQSGFMVAGQTVGQLLGAIDDRNSPNALGVLSVVWNRLEDQVQRFAADYVGSQPSGQSKRRMVRLLQAIRD